MNISVILPAYKESENIKSLLPKLNKALIDLKIDYEILVIDTMKPMDNSEQICIDNNVTYINRHGGNLYGDAIRTGISAAIGNYIVIMDSDGSHNPEDIKRFYVEINKNNDNLIIGSRYCKGGNSHNGYMLKSMSWILNFTYRIVFGLKVKDVSDSFRMYEAKKLKNITLECENFDIVEEILIRLKLKYKDLKIKEVPIYFNKRIYGESKRDLIKFVKSYLRTMVKLYNIKKNYK